MVFAEALRFPHGSVAAVTAASHNRNAKEGHIVPFVVAIPETLLTEHAGAVRLTLHTVKREVSFLEHVAAHPLTRVFEVCIELFFVLHQQATDPPKSLLSSTLRRQQSFDRNILRDSRIAEHSNQRCRRQLVAQNVGCEQFNL